MWGNRKRYWGNMGLNNETITIPSMGKWGNRVISRTREKRVMLVAVLRGPMTCWGCSQLRVTSQGKNQGNTFTSFWSPAGAPHWPNPTTSQRALEFFDTNMSASLKQRAGLRRASVPGGGNKSKQKTSGTVLCSSFKLFYASLECGIFLAPVNKYL